MKRLIATAALAGLVASPAFAQSYQYSPVEGPYLGAGIGHASLDFDIDNFYGGQGASNVNSDDSDTGYKLFAGYQFNPNFVVEASYLDFGEATASGTVNGESARAKAEAEGFGFALVGKLPIQNGFSVHGKLGMIAWDGDRTESYTTNINSTRVNDSYSSDGTDPFYGIGAEYVVQQIMMRGEYERYDISDSGEDLEIDLVSASLGYRF